VVLDEPRDRSLEPRDANASSAEQEQSLLWRPDRCDRLDSL